VQHRPPRGASRQRREACGEPGCSSLRTRASNGAVRLPPGRLASPPRASRRAVDFTLFFGRGAGI